MNIPNVLTVARIAMVPVFVAFYVMGFEDWNYWAMAIFTLASLTDLFDGMLARKMDCVTNFGKLMDPIADKLLVTCALLVLLDWGKIDVIVCAVLIAREFFVTGIRLLGTEQGKIIPADLWGKIKTATQLVAICIILIELPMFRSFPLGIILIYISVAISLVSCVRYVYKNADLIKNTKL